MTASQLFVSEVFIELSSLGFRGQSLKTLILKKCSLALEADLREVAWKSAGPDTQELCRGWQELGLSSWQRDAAQTHVRNFLVGKRLGTESVH